MNDYYTLNEVCQKLQISAATGKNWLRRGLLTADLTAAGQPFFRPDTVQHLLTVIQSADTKTLKSRRNKKQISGIAIYRDYLPPCAVNLPALEQIIDAAQHEPLIAENSGQVLAEHAIRLFCQARKLPLKTVGGSALRAYLDGEIDLGNTHLLIDDLLDANITTDIPLQALAPALLPELTYTCGEDTLGLLYLSLKNSGSRKNGGVYYTPAAIVEKILADLPLAADHEAAQKIIDPCCGTGNFLLAAAQKIGGISSLYGQDTDALAVQIARINLALSYPAAPLDQLYTHLTCGNTLHKLPAERYDFIIGNPPWGSVLDLLDAPVMAENYRTARTKNPEAYDLFLENALQHLTEQGIVAFVLPEAILNVAGHRVIREIVLERAQIKRLSYLGNVFDGVNCPAIVLVLQNGAPPYPALHASIETAAASFQIQTKRLLTPVVFNLNITDEEYRLLTKIAACPHCQTLKGQAEFALGIVTGDNQKFLSSTATADHEPIFKGSDIARYALKKPQSFLEFQPQNYQQVAPLACYRAPEKLFYRYICAAPVFAYDNRQQLSLNSCNILIPHLPNLELKYVLAILNSSVAHFFLSKTFNSLKMLRSHLEQLPIPVCSPVAQKKIVSTTNQLMATDDSRGISLLYRIIDEQIMDLFELRERERKLIQDFSAGYSNYLDRS